MKRYGTIVIGALFVASVGLAAETTTGDINQEAADATQKDRENSEVGVNGVTVIDTCYFEGTAFTTATADNIAYFTCIRDAATAAGYSPSYFVGTNSITILDGSSELDGICHAEDDAEIDWVEVTMEHVSGTYAKIVMLPQKAAAGGTVYVELNGHTIDLTGTGISPGADLLERFTDELDENYDGIFTYEVGTGGHDYIVIGADTSYPDETMWHVGIGSSNRHLFRTLVSLEPDSDPTTTYCNP